MPHIHDRLSRFLPFILSLFLLTVCPDERSLQAQQNNQITHIEKEAYVSFSPVDGYFPLASNGSPVPLYIHEDDNPGVIRAYRDLQADIERVTDSRPDLSTGTAPVAERVVIAGTIGQNPEIDRLITEGKLDVSEIEGRWETFVLTVVDAPYPGTNEALVIAGSDKRGTIYGIYELSEQIGVSPWYWWADVPVVQQTDLYVSPEPHTIGEPSVKYRGIFINNENPSLYGWVNRTYGGFNHDFYEEVFELILRLKGNYLWSAMWGKAFHDDDPMNPEMADMYGVVVGYTHHEPMMRAHIEWDRYGEGPWNYETNEETLREFWRDGVERMGSYESSVALGMRGDGDEPMSDEANIELLQRIVEDQREILEESTEPENSNYFQLWALYKEVLDYYEQGMEVPEDVMLLLANDNWGNVRLLPDPETAGKREGGWGMYYHFDYVGGPRNYKWINTVQISRIWEQMKLTYEHKVDDLWLVNVGDIKPMEFPITFFLDLAWNPDGIDTEEMDGYAERWAKQQFGEEFAEEIGYMLTESTRYNSRRKPELLEPETYSLIHFREAERIVDDFNALVDRSSQVYEQLSDDYRAAYFQLLQYPIEAAANVNELYVTAAKNQLYADQGRAATNELAEKAREHFEHNDELDETYHTINDGKWQHMMDQTRIGYTYWQQPEQNNMPEVRKIDIPSGPRMGVAIEGSDQWWPQTDEEATLPAFDPYKQQEYYIEVFNRGSEPFSYSVETGETWVQTSMQEGRIDKQERIIVTVDWDSAPEGEQRVPVTISSETGSSVTVHAEIFNPETPSRDELDGYVESNSFVSMEAPNYSRSTSDGNARWKQIPELGRTHSAMTPWPVLADSFEAGDASAPTLEYDIHLFTPGEVTVKVYLSPTLNYSRNYRNKDGIRYGISFNDSEPQVMNMHEPMEGGFSNNVWYRWAGNNINIVESTHTISEPGQHTLKIQMIDTGIVVQKIVVETADVPQTYLGPPESFRGE